MGVVFDLDGTLTDNMACHADAFAIFVRRHGLPEFTMAMRERLDGKRNSEIFPILFNRNLSVDEIRAFSEEKESAYRELSRERLQPLPGAVALLECLAARGIGVAVATSAPEKNVAHTLGAIGLADRIGIITRSDAVPRGSRFRTYSCVRRKNWEFRPTCALPSKTRWSVLPPRAVPVCAAPRSRQPSPQRPCPHQSNRPTPRIETSMPISKAMGGG